MAMLNAACKNFGGVLAVRLILGSAEAGFAASLTLYLTTFYTRGELGKRVAVFYSCNALAGAFSGLIAYGVFQMNSKLWGWQILMLIEGAFTVAFSGLVAWALPCSTETASFLSPREKEVARLRVLRDGSVETNVKLQSSSFFKPLKDWRFYVLGLIAICYGNASSMAGNFLTQIIGRFHFSVVQTNLYTVAPFTLGTLTCILTAYSSDHFRERGLHLASSLVFVFVGCIILVSIPVSKVGVGYFATFLITAGIHTSVLPAHTA